MTSWGSSSRLGDGGDGDPLHEGPLREPRLRVDPRSFYHTSPRALLPRILDGDPLDLALRSTRRRDALGYLVSRRRLLLVSAARCAHAGYRYQGHPPPDAWLEQCIDLAIRDILTEDEADDRRGLPVRKESHYEMLSEALGFTPSASRSAHVAFNALDEEARAAYFALSVHGSSVEEFSAAGGGPPELIRENLSRAVDALIRHLPTGRKDDRN